jgi:NADH-quinone oxidoreductase subunit A
MTRPLHPLGGVLRIERAFVDDPTQSIRIWAGRCSRPDPTRCAGFFERAVREILHEPGSGGRIGFESVATVARRRLDGVGMDAETTSFVPILIYLGVVLGFAGVTLIAAHVIGPRKSTKVKDMPYESGMDPDGDARNHFDIRFYIVAILFLIFDVELLFLYPWAVSAYIPDGGVPAALGSAVFGVMTIFIATLAIAYVYAWKKGIFEWR